MIKDKIFSDLKELNNFKDQNMIRVISINSMTRERDTGLPMMKGGSFIVTEEVLKVFYENVSTVI